MSASHLFAIHSTYEDIETGKVTGSHQTTSFNGDNDCSRLTHPSVVAHQVPTPNVPDYERTYAILEPRDEDEGTAV